MTNGSVQPIPGGIAPIISIVFGSILSLGIAYIIATLGEVVILNLLILDREWGFIPFWLLFCLSTFGLFLNGLGNDVPIGYRGVPTFLGGRLSWLLLGEGTHWLFPALMRVETVNAKIQPTQPRKIETLSRDGVLMKSEYILQIRVYDPYKFLSVDDAIESIHEIGDAVVRDVFAKEDSFELIKADMKGRLAGSIDDAISDVAESDFGIDVMKVFEPEIRLPPEVEEAMARARKEEAEAIAEKIELDALQARVKEMTKDGEISVDRAYEILQTERGKAKAERRIFRVEDADKIADALAGVIKNIVGKGGS